MQYLISLFFSLFSIKVAFAAPVIIAAPDATTTLLAPLGTILQNTSSGVTLTEYLNGIFQISIALAGVLAVIMLVICGIRVMGTGSVSAKSEAKTCITNALLGLLLISGSWIILNTINPTLLSNNTNIVSIQQKGTLSTGPGGVTVQEMPVRPGFYYQYSDGAGNLLYSDNMLSIESCSETERMFSKNPPKPGAVVTVSCFQVGAPPPPASETAVRNAICGNNNCFPGGLSNSNVFVNKASCNPPNANGVLNGCTNVAGMSTDAVEAIKALAVATGQKIIITGGTEVGHVTHAPGYSIFDISRNSEVFKYIKQNSLYPQNKSFSKTINGDQVQIYKWLYNEYWYSDEGDHLHVCKNGTTYAAVNSTAEELRRQAAILKGCNKMQ